MTDLLDAEVVVGEAASSRHTLTPDAAAVCAGTVRHARERPEPHRFERPVTMIWIDPDRPDDLFGRHPLWSARRPAPVRFDTSDYGIAGSDGSLAMQARGDLGPVVGEAPVGAVRMLTQPRSYGWLFNPLTLYFVWGRDEMADPVGVVAEVTNTPWKERHRYPIAFEGGLESSFHKAMHVSPFLGMDMRYQLRVRAAGERLQVSVDVVNNSPGPDRADEPMLCTLLDMVRQPASAHVLSRTMLRQPFPTHRVSAAILVEAAKLWAKRVPFVAHPRRGLRALRASTTDEQGRR